MGFEIKEHKSNKHKENEAQKKLKRKDCKASFFCGRNLIWFTKKLKLKMRKKYFSFFIFQKRREKSARPTELRHRAAAGAGWLEEALEEVYQRDTPE